MRFKDPFCDFDLIFQQLILLKRLLSSLFITDLELMVLQIFLDSEMDGSYCFILLILIYYLKLAQSKYLYFNLTIYKKLKKHIMIFSVDY